MEVQWPGTTNLILQFNPMIIIMPCIQAGTNNPSPRQKRSFHSPSERTGQSPDFLNFPQDWCNANKNYRACGGNDWGENRGKTSLGNGWSMGVLWCSNLRFPVRGPLEGKCSAQFWEDACSPLCLSGLGMWIPPGEGVRCPTPSNFTLRWISNSPKRTTEDLLLPSYLPPATAPEKDLFLQPNSNRLCL